MTTAATITAAMTTTTISAADRLAFLQDMRRTLADRLAAVTAATDRSGAVYATLVGTFLAIRNGEIVVTASSLDAAACDEIDRLVQDVRISDGGGNRFMRTGRDTAMRNDARELVRAIETIDNVIRFTEYEGTATA